MMHKTKNLSNVLATSKDMHGDNQGNGKVGLVVQRSARNTDSKKKVIFCQFKSLISLTISRLKSRNLSEGRCGLRKSRRRWLDGSMSEYGMGYQAHHLQKKNKMMIMMMMMMTLNSV
jgi:hypothetical protein